MNADEIQMKPRKMRTTRIRVAENNPNGIGSGLAPAKRRGVKLLHLFNDEHFDGHIGGNKFEAIMRQ